MPQSKLSRSHLYLMATAKAKTAGHCAVVAPAGKPTAKLRKALEAADAALKAVFAALEGQVEE